MRAFSLSTLTAIILLALAVPAFGHVTVQPTTAPTGSFFRFDVRAPNERDDADTTKVEVDFPDTLTNVNFQPKDGWQRTVTMKTLDEPVTVFGSEVTEVIDTVTWEGGTIAPGEFDEFGFTARTPDDPTTLAFPSIQTYSSGEEVAWIGEPDSDEPAPRVEVTATDDTDQTDDTATETDDPATVPDEAEEDVNDDDGGGARTRANIALVLGSLGMAAGLGSGFMSIRRR